jgi:hypothetical protein
MPWPRKGCALPEKTIARQLVAKAQLDLNAVSELLSKSDLKLIGHETIGFHLQQAVEKSTKALLAWNNIDYEYNHNLKNLFKLTNARLSPIPPRFKPLLRLTPYATGLRYVTMMPSDLFNCDDMLVLASDYMDWIASLM